MLLSANVQPPNEMIWVLDVEKRQEHSVTELKDTSLVQIAKIW